MFTKTQLNKNLETHSLNSHRQNELDKIVEQYLEMDTNYALLITGKWGTGKTHYYNKILVPKVINNTNVLGNAQKYYKAARISLFGIETLDDIYSQLFLELYPLLKSKQITAGKGIAKVLLRGYLRVKIGIRDLDKYMSDLFKSAKTLVDFEEVVLCFDDLERKDPKFEISSLIGFINTLVEDNNIKVLIIANKDNGILENKDYKDVLEKTIGAEVQFQSNLSDIFEEIVKERFKSKGDKLYSDFLLREKNLISDLFQKAEEVNLRKLIFGLGFFKKLFYELKLKYNTELDSEYWQERLQSILGYTLALAIEYKGKWLSSNDENGKNLRELGKGVDSITLIAKHFASGEKEVFEAPANENYIQLFQRKYRSKNWFFYSYSSIFDFITGSSSFSLIALEKELEIVVKLLEDKVKPHYKLYHSLAFPEASKYTDIEFKETVEKVISFVGNGDYDLDTIVGIYLLIAHYNEIFDYDLHELAEEFKAGMEKASSSLPANDESLLQTNLAFKEVSGDLKSIVDELKKTAETLNQAAITRENTSEAERLFKLFKENSEGFFEELSRQNNSQWSHQPILHYFDKNDFSKCILDFSNQTLSLFLKFVRERYRSPMSLEHLNKEKEIMQFVAESLKQATKKNKALSSWLLGLIAEHIRKVFPIEVLVNER